MAEADEDGLGEEEEERGYRDEEQSVADVRDAGGDTWAGRVGGRRGFDDDAGALRGTGTGVPSTGAACGWE